MDLREQVLQFRTLLEENGFAVDDFELNVNSDAFRELLAGGKGSLEVYHRQSDIAIEYPYDGTSSWIDRLSEDLTQGKFQSRS